MNSTEMRAREISNLSSGVTREHQETIGKLPVLTHRCCGCHRTLSQARVSWPSSPGMYIKYKGILHEIVGDMNGFHKTILRENSRLKRP